MISEPWRKRQNIFCILRKELPLKVSDIQEWIKQKNIFCSFAGGASSCRLLPHIGRIFSSLKRWTRGGTMDKGCFIFLNRILGSTGHCTGHSITNIFLFYITAHWTHFFLFKEERWTRGVLSFWIVKHFGLCRSLYKTMVLILDGNSLRGAHVRRNIFHSICSRHLITSRAVTNRVFLPEKTHFPLCVRNM